jgi:hypothetical protein
MKFILLMRLRGEITTDLLGRIAAILSACGSDVILYFSPEEVSLCVPGDNSQIAVWVGSPVQCCFNKYNIASKTMNTISLKTTVAQLAQSLATTEQSIQMVLGRTGDASYLQFTHKSLDSLKQLEHRIPVLVLSHATVVQYAEPDWGPETMKAKFPSLRSIQKWCAIAKTINKNFIISISRDPDSGTVDVEFKVETDVVSVSTKFTNLGIDDGPDATEAAASECDVLINLKKFLKILKVIALSPSFSVLYIYDKKSLRLNFQVPSASTLTSFTYVINATMP